MFSEAFKCKFQTRLYEFSKYGIPVMFHTYEFSRNLLQLLSQSAPNSITQSEIMAILQAQKDTSLQTLAKNDNLEMFISFIEELKTDISKTSSTNESALLLALDNENWDVVEYLLEKGRK